jgi:hypothetical protein
VTGQPSAGDGGQNGEPRPGADLAAEFQRWLVRSSARSVRQELTGQFRRAFGPRRAETGDIWGVATTEPPPDALGEAPECAWCPVCRAARRIRESGPGLGAPLAGASDVVAAAVQEALSAFDSVLSMRPPMRPPVRPRTANPPRRPSRPPSADKPDARAAGTPPEVPDHEPDDRG